MLSGDCNVALCGPGWYLSCKSVGKILVMWEIQKYKRMNLGTELIPVNAKMNNCSLSLARLAEKRQIRHFQCYKLISSKSSTMSIFISE